MQCENINKSSDDGDGGCDKSRSASRWCHFFSLVRLPRPGESAIQDFANKQSSEGTSLDNLRNLPSGLRGCPIDV